MVVLVVVALLLRLYRLDGRSLWLDEILSAQPAHLDSPSAVIAWSRAAINQMPLFYIFIWLVGHWGDSGFILRLPAAIAGTLLVPSVFFLGRSLLGVRAGLIAALLTAVLPFIVWYSQEARAYSLLMLLTTLQMYFALRAVTRPNVLNWAGLGVFSILNLYTHYVAITAMAAVTVYVAAFIAADLLSGASIGVKASAVAVVLAVLVAAVVERHALLDLVTNSIARMHGHRTLLVVSAVVTAALLSAVGAAAWRSWPAFKAVLTSRRMRRLEFAVPTALVVAIAYAPWLSSLRLFLSRPDQSLGQIHLAHQPGLSDLAYTLSSLSLDGLPLLFLVVGLAAVIYWTVMGQATTCGLLLAWIGVPLVILTASAGANVVAIDPRYVSFLVPACLIVIAAGVEAVVIAARWAGPRLGASRSELMPRAAFAAVAVLTVLLLVQIIPALVTSYSSPKNDWRGAAARVVDSNPTAMAVISVGNYADWSVICLNYYFKEMHAPIDVEDARSAGSPLAGRLRGSSGQVWGIVIFPSAEQMGLLGRPGAVKTTFVDTTRSIWLVRTTDPNLSPLDQLTTILRWELPLQPELAATLSRVGAAD